MNMARKKGESDKPATSSLTIDVDSFVRTRDSVVTGLATLQDAIQTLSSAYIKHTNAVLGEHGAGLDVETALSRLGENPLLGGLGGLRDATSVAPAVPADAGKKEKKKRVHDPNAPKRPLTPYFLYMQTARPIIAEDLGPEVAKGAVSAEGVRRWNAMVASDKQLWTQAYTDNLKLYNARMHSYKSGNLNAKDMTDEEAAAYAEVHNIGATPLDATANGQLTAEALLDAPGVEDEPPAPAAAAAAPAAARATPKGKAPARKSKGPGNIVPPPASAIVPPAQPKPTAATPASAGDKRKRQSKKGDEVVASVEKEEETPKSGAKPRKKKAKTDA